MAEWLKALVSKTGIPFTGYRGFESPFFRKTGSSIAAKAAVLFCYMAEPSSLKRRHIAKQQQSPGGTCCFLLCKGPRGEREGMWPTEGRANPPRRGAGDSTSAASGIPRGERLWIRNSTKTP